MHFKQNDYPSKVVLHLAFHPTGQVQRLEVLKFTLRSEEKNVLAEQMTQYLGFKCDLA